MKSTKSVCADWPAVGRGARPSTAPGQAPAGLVQFVAAVSTATDGGSSPVRLRHARVRYRRPNGCGHTPPRVAGADGWRPSQPSRSEPEPGGQSRRSAGYVPPGAPAPPPSAAASGRAAAAGRGGAPRAPSRRHSGSQTKFRVGGGRGRRSKVATSSLNSRRACSTGPTRMTTVRLTAFPLVSSAPRLARSRRATDQRL